MKQKALQTIRRSIAIPRKLLEEVQAHADGELKSNMNRLVTVALHEFVAKRKRRKFEETMAEMAADPKIRQECERINQEFLVAEYDGLANLTWNEQKR